MLEGRGCFYGRKKRTQEDNGEREAMDKEIYILTSSSPFARILNGEISPKAEMTSMRKPIEIDCRTRVHCVGVSSVAEPNGC